MKIYTVVSYYLVPYLYTQCFHKYSSKDPCQLLYATQLKQDMVMIMFHSFQSISWLESMKKYNNKFMSMFFQNKVITTEIENWKLYCNLLSQNCTFLKSPCNAVRMIVKIMIFNRFNILNENHILYLSCESVQIVAYVVTSFRCDCEAIAW